MTPLSWLSERVVKEKLPSQFLLFRQFMKALWLNWLQTKRHTKSARERYR